MITKPKKPATPKEVKEVIKETKAAKIDTAPTGKVYFWKSVQRNRIALIIIVVIAVCVYFLPPEARMGLLGLFTTKMMGISLGVLIAHFGRLYLFPYMDLSTMLAEHHWPGVIFMAAWYVVIIFCFSMGG